jgi:hypothetical protein
MLLADNSIGRALLTRQNGEDTEQQQTSYKSWLKAKVKRKFLSLLQYNDERTSL